MIFAPDLLAGQVAIVTGGGAGIGLGIARELARVGADLVLCGRRPEPLAAAAEEIRAMGRRCLAIPADVRNWEQVQALVAATLAEFGRIDILVNNAGGQFAAPVEKMSPGGWKAVIDVNLNGVFHCIKAVSDTMIQQRRGKIINIIAAFTRRGAPGVAHSGAARAGVENLSRSLAIEWARYNIQVNCISPIVMTEGLEANLLQAPGTYDRLLQAIPVGRFGTLEEVGWAAVFLASRAADYITGENLAMDGANWLGSGISWVNA